jgi:flavin reductase (DIM6/NTAB) family NADH-FMN oxidoreductase RutF
VAKQILKPGPYVVPMPVVLVGSLVDGKPNFMTAAFCGIANVQPPVITLGLSPSHRTSRGIEEHRQLSVNLPSEDQAVVTDWCGLVSGKDVDKSGVFETYTGALEAAPLVASVPLAAGCRLLHTLPLGVDTLYVAEIVDVRADEEILDRGEVDWAKVRPLLFTFPQPSYWRLGGFAGRAWSIGKGFRKS